MKRERRVGIGLLIAGSVVLALSLPAMSRRLRDHNDRSNFQRHAFQRINEEEFDFGGEPASVRLREGSSGSAGVAAPRVEITWRGETAVIAAGGRSEGRLPGLLKVDDWLQVLEVRDLERGQEGVRPSAGGARVVVVARRPAPGADDAKYVDRKGWVYDIVELRRRGDAGAEPLPAPSTDRGSGRAERSPLVNKFEQSESFARWTVNFAALPDYERTWQYAVALAVTPRLSYPRNKFTDDGLEAMGWTWPVAGVGVLGVVCGVVCVGAAGVRRPGPAVGFRRALSA